MKTSKDDVFDLVSPLSPDLHTISPFITMLVPDDSKLSNACPQLICFSVVEKKAVGKGFKPISLLTQLS